MQTVSKLAMSVTQFVTEAPTAWKLLNGILCLYKPAGFHSLTAQKLLKAKIANELCEMECRDQYHHVLIEGNTTKDMSVTVIPSYADHPLVIGPRYQSQDIRCLPVMKLGKNTSGVFLVGLNAGVKRAFAFQKDFPLRTFHLRGKLGQATDNFFMDGKIIEKSKYEHVRRDRLERLLASIQASHQSKIFDLSGVDPQSQEAYNLAVKGPIRPATTEIPIIYGLKCIEFKPPDFMIEVQCINETEEFLMVLVHELGYKLRSAATCSGIQCVRHAYFSVCDALLKKHWTLQNILDNLTACKKILNKHKSTPHLLEMPPQDRSDIYYDTV